MDGMEFQVPVGHKSKGEILGQQALRVPLGHKDKGEWLEQQALMVPPGPRNGGVVYTRCSYQSVSGTELVYAGRAGGTDHTHKGEAANHLCMPNDPDKLHYQSRAQGYNYVYGVEYHTNPGPFSAVHNHNAPCAEKTHCPSTWTLEFSGYPLSAHYSHHNSMFECVDKKPDSTPGSATNTNGALFYHVEANCNGMACPPYDPQKNSPVQFVPNKV